VQTFLLEASVFDSLSGPLCDALSGRKDGQRTLERLERDNLLVVPLDDNQVWYRYHHLFADFLRQGQRFSPAGLVRLTGRRDHTGGTLAATGLRYSSNEVVFDTIDTIYAICREARSRNGPSRSISSSYVPL
jgi:LuxR family transcriptional regulator, maltose regulon positive regulatory protein